MRSLPRIVLSCAGGLFFSTTISLFSQATLRNRHSLLFSSATWGGLVLLLTVASFLVIPLIYKKIKQFGKGNAFILVLFCIGMSALVLKTISTSQLSFNNLMFFISIPGSGMDKNKEIWVAEVKNGNQFFDLGNFLFMKGCRPTKNYPIICKGASVIKYVSETSDGTILPINILLFDQTRSDLISSTLDIKSSFISLNNIYQNRSVLFMALWIDHRLIRLMVGFSLGMLAFCLLLFTGFSRNFQTGLNIFRIQPVLGLFTQLIGLVLVSKFFFSSSFLENLGFSKKNLLEAVLGLLFVLLGELFYENSRNKNNSVVLNFKSRIVFLWIPAFIVVFYAWTTFSSGTPDRENYFGYLSQAFSEKQLSLLILPEEKLLALADPYDPVQNLPYRLHVASLYKGKYYLYWGPVNTLIFYLPFYIYSGKLLSNDLACTLFGGGGFLFSVASLYQVRKKYYPNVSFYGVALCVIILGLSNVVPAIIRRPLYFEIAILGAYFWASISVFLYVLAISTERPNISFFSLSAIAYAFAFGSRINYILGSVVFVFPAWVIWQMFNKVLSRGAMLKMLIKYFLAVGVPLMIMLGALLFYNFARFDNFLDFGINYQLDSIKNSDHLLQDIKQIPYNTYLYLFLPVKLNSYFPFFHLQSDNMGLVPSFIPVPGFRNCIGCKNFGIIINTPFLWVVIFSSIGLLLWGKRLPSQILKGSVAIDYKLFLICVALLVISVGNMYVVFQMFGHVLRYSLDFLPYILLASCIVFFSIISCLKNNRFLYKIFYPIVSLCVLYSSLLNLSISIEGVEEPLLKTNAPLLYADIRSGFDFVPYLVSLYSRKDDVRVITVQPFYSGKYYEYEVPAAEAQVRLAEDALTLKIFAYETGWIQIMPNYEFANIVSRNPVSISVTEINGDFKNTFVVWPKSTPILLPVKKGKNSYLFAIDVKFIQENSAGVIIKGMDIVRK